MQGMALQEHGYVQLPYNESLKKPLGRLMNAWKDFCGQSLSHKLQYPMTMSGGYESKQKIGQTFDEKEDFHLSLAYDIWSIEKVVITPIDKEFVEAGHDFIREVYDLIMDVGSVFGQDSMFDLVEEFSKAFERWTIRLLRYPAGVTEHEIAVSHVDKGITVHFAEDAPGLEVFWRNEWKLVEPMHGHILAYSGMLGQYYSECRFPALCHRVVSTPQTFANGRNSIVMFIDFGNVVYDKERFGRTQDVFPQGENYEMPFDQFKQLFAPLAKRVL